MDFEFTEDQRMLQHCLRDVAENDIAPTILEYDERQEYPLVVDELSRVGG